MSRIHPSVVLQNTTLGKDVYIGPNSSVGGAALVFDGEWVQAKDGEVLIGDNVYIGMNTSIERGISRETIIGSDCKIGSQVHISHDVHLGGGTVIPDGCTIGHHATLDKDTKLAVNGVVHART